METDFYKFVIGKKHGKILCRVIEYECFRPTITNEITLNSNALSIDNVIDEVLNIAENVITFDIDKDELEQALYCNFYEVTNKKGNKVLVTWIDY